MRGEGCAEWSTFYTSGIVSRFDKNFETIEHFNKFVHEENHKMSLALTPLTLCISVLARREQVAPATSLLYALKSLEHGESLAVWYEKDRSIAPYPIGRLLASYYST